MARLDEIAGCGVIAAQAVIAEIGLDMTVFGTPGRLVSWAKRCPRTRQSGKKATGGAPGKGNPWLNGILGEIAAIRRPAPIPSSANATAASPAAAASARPSSRSPAPSWSSSSTCSPTPPARFRDLGPDYYDTRTDRTARSATTSASSKPSA